MIKYSNKIGQKTGMLQNSKNVQINEINVAIVDEYLNIKNNKRNVNLIKLQN